MFMPFGIFTDNWHVFKKKIKAKEICGLTFCIRISKEYIC